MPDNDIARHGRPDNAGRRRQGVARLIRSRRAQLAAGAAVIGLALVPAMGVAVSNSLHVSGPTSNKIGTPFIEEISGHAKGAANFVVAREQYYRHSRCAATYAAESTRAFLPSTYRRTLWVDQSVHGNDSITAHYGAVNLDTHGICAYLISLSSGNTYTHGGIFWTNHTSASRPCTEALAGRCTAPPAT
jgi:hypothetical protein